MKKEYKKPEIREVEMESELILDGSDTPKVRMNNDDAEEQYDIL